MQKISPEGKAKIQLQVVLHDNTTSTFQFCNRQGAAAAIRERDQVKDLLVQLLPKFKRKVNKELEEKNRYEHVCSMLMLSNESYVWIMCSSLFY